MEGFISHIDLINNYKVPYETIRKGIYRFSKVGKSWANFNYSDKEIFIKIDSIPKRTKSEYNIPTADEYEDLKKVQAYEAEQAAQKQEVDEIAQKLSRAYNEEYLEYVSLYENHLVKGSSEVKQKAIQAAKEHAFWLEVVTLSGGGYRADRNTLNKLWPHYRDFVFRRPLNYYQHFSRKANEIRRALFNKDTQEVIKLVAGAHSVRKNMGNAKTDKFHEALCLVVLSNPKKYSYRVAKEMINHHCKQEGKSTISQSWIKLKMNNDNIFRTLVDEGRNGKKAFSDSHETYLKRLPAAFPANEWQIDGTPLQFYCYNENRSRIIRPYLFVVLDVCSRKIVGFDIAYSEDRFNVMNSIEMAYKLNGHGPKRLVSDNFSASKTEEFKQMSGIMAELGTVWRYAKVKNAQDKGHVERWFETFQSEFCALCDDYLGEGIMTRREHGKRDPEFIADVYKKQGYSSFDEMQSRIVKLITRYNDKERIGGKTPNEIYRTFPKPNAVELNAWQTAKMFWKTTKNTILRSRVKIKVQGQEYLYEIKDQDLKLELHKKQVRVRYDERDLSSVMLFDWETDQVLCNCDQFVPVAMDEIGENEEATLAVIKHEAKKKAAKNYRETKRKTIIDEGLKGTELEYEAVKNYDPLSIDKDQKNSKESDEMQAHYFNTKEIIAHQPLKNPNPFEVRSKHMGTNKTAPFKNEAV